MIAKTIQYLLLMLSFSGGFLVLISRLDTSRQLGFTFMLGILLSIVVALTALMFPIMGFGRLKLLAWGVFFVLPIYLLGAYLLLANDHRPEVYLLLVLIGLEAVIGLDAFLIEPRWLQVSHTTLSSPKLDQSVTIAVLADIQTNQPGDYESRVLALVKEEDPDLVLFAGDYLQLKSEEAYWSAVGTLNEIIIETGLNPPLGSFAVRGNVDWNGWSQIFEDTAIITIEETTRLDLGPLVLTGLGWQDSLNTHLELGGEKKYHLVLGHTPNYSMGVIEGDLLLAGHTHGGQVQLPGVGPIFTLSEVPRSWASGLTEINPQQYLKVSRGIGMERGSAPKMRFLCRPELVILELVPEK